MSKWTGNRISVEIYGTSHSESIGAKCQGFPSSNFSIDKLNEFISRRKPNGEKYLTGRNESDEITFVSGVERESIISNVFEIRLENIDVKKDDYNNLYGKPRPSHSDLGAFLKDGTLDFSGGGRFSGRLTAPLCVVGGIAKQILEQRGIIVHAYLGKVGRVKGKSYKDSQILPSDFGGEYNSFPSLSDSQKMIDEILEARENGDSVGSIIECVVFDMPVGVGDSLFDGLEGKISQLLFSIPAVKGVEFGLGFDFCLKKASQVNDQIYIENGKIKTYTNNNGGINGGISNGMTLTLSVVVKPTPSISIEQKTVDLVKKENTTINVKGRHDACVGVRAVPVVESAVCIALLDSLRN